MVYRQVEESSTAQLAQSLQISQGTLWAPLSQIQQMTRVEQAPEKLSVHLAVN